MMRNSHKKVKINRRDACRNFYQTMRTFRMDLENIPISNTFLIKDSLQQTSNSQIMQSPSNIRLAKLYLKRKANAQQMAWNASSVMHNFLSLMGPNNWRQRQISVILGTSLSSGCRFSHRYSSFLHGNVDGSIRPVSALNFGSLCLGQGTKRNS